MKILLILFTLVFCPLMMSSALATETGDFLISDDGSGTEQNNPTIAVGLNGHFAVIWVDYASANGEIYCRMYDSGAVPSGTIFNINDDTTDGWQLDPELASDWNGKYYAVWQDYRNSTYPFNPDIYYQRFDSNGLIGSNINITTERPDSSHQSPAIGASGWGKTVAAWMDVRNRNWDVYVQKLSATGVLIGSNRKVNGDASTTAQLEPEVAVSDEGWFVVVWYDGRNGNDDIYMQKFDSSGNAIGSNIRVNDDIGTAKQKFPAVAVSGTGVITVVWTDWRRGSYPQNSDIYGQRFSSDLTRLGSNVMINLDGTNTSQRNPRVASDRMGNTCVVWSDSSGTTWQATGQAINYNGDFQGVNFAVNLDSPGDQLFPDVALDGYDMYLVWADDRNGDFDIYGRVHHYNDPSLRASPSELSFSTDRSSTDSTQQRLIIKNVGRGQLEYRLASPQSWITLSQDTGTTPDTVNVSVNAQGLGLGTYHGWITLINATESDSTAIVPVTLTVTGPIIDLTPDSLVYQTLTTLGDPAVQNLLVLNSGTGSFLWHLEKGAAWITIDTTDGAAGDLIHVGCNISLLAEGDFTGQLVFTSAEAANSPDTLNIRLSIRSNVPFIDPTPTAVHETLAVGQSDSGTITVGNSGTGTLHWHATSSTAWLSLQSDSGGNYGQIAYTISAVGLSVQEYYDTIRIVDTSAFNSPVLIPVDLVVAAADTVETTAANVESAKSGRIQLYLRAHNAIESGLLALGYDRKMIKFDSITSAGDPGLEGRITIAIDSAVSLFTLTIAADSAGSALSSGRHTLGELYFTANDSLVGKTSFTPDTGSSQFFVMTFNAGACRPAALLGDIEISVSTDANGQGRRNLPLVFSLGQNSPNPFNGQTAIPFSLARPGPVRLEIYNILGQLIRVLIDGAYSAGSYQASWDGTGGKGREMASGIYFYRLITEDHIAVRKMLLMK